MTDRRDELEARYLRALAKIDMAHWRARHQGEDKSIDRDAVVGTADVRCNGPRMIEAAE
jgi:hypothetical protein